MHSLVLSRADHLPFDVAVLEARLRSDRYVKAIERKLDFEMSMHITLEIGGENVVASMLKTDDAIFLRRTDEVAIAAMLAIGRSCRYSIRLSDTDYSFDIILNPGQSVDQVKRRMRSGEVDESFGQ